MFKRCFDVSLVILALPFWLPLLVSVAIMVRIKIGAPVFFIQKRPGLYGKPFNMVKFRTMKNTCDENGNLLPDSERMVPFGRWLRSSSLDELPEFWNVLKGEMSLVGPRPLLMQYLPLYNDEQARRHHVRPGITGWAQINGRNSISWDDKFKLDSWYVDHHSIYLDIKIMLLTIKKIIKKNGITEAGEATMSEFKGNP